MTLQGDIQSRSQRMGSGSLQDELVLLYTLVGHILDMIAVDVLDRMRVGKVSIHVNGRVQYTLSHSHTESHSHTLDHTE